MRGKASHPLLHNGKESVPPALPLRICSFESRRAEDMASLIRRHGGEPTVVPSMREIPLEDNAEAIEFGAQLLAGEVDVFIFMTGVGAKALLDLLETRYSRESVHAALADCQIVVRGPKPVVVLRARKIRIDHRAAEPNTWREIVDVLRENDLIDGRTIAVQEYGQPNDELLRALTESGANVLTVPIYRWDLPEDCGELERAIERTIAGEFDVLMFTSAQQIANVLQVAGRMGRSDEFRKAAGKLLIASIGPTCSEAIQQAGLRVGVEASPTKMGRLVAQTVAVAGETSADGRG